MPNDNQARPFDPFSRTATNAAETGGGRTCVGRTGTRACAPRSGRGGSEMRGGVSAVRAVDHAHLDSGLAARPAPAQRAHRATKLREQGNGEAGRLQVAPTDRTNVQDLDKRRKFVVRRSSATRRRYRGYA